MALKWNAFLTRPLLFAQIYIICEYFDGFMISCAYCLTSKKDQIVYKKIFNHLITLGSRMNIRYHLETVTCNFEVAAINTFSRKFLDASIAGYFFHYSQYLWGKVQDLRLTRLVSGNASSNDFSDDDKKRTDHWF